MSYKNEQGNIEELLAAKREIKRLEALLNALPNNLYLKDLDGKYIFLNDFSRQQLREAHKISDNIIGKKDADVFPKSAVENFIKNDKKVIETGMQSVEEEEVELPSGETLTQLSFKKPLYDDTGKTIGIIGHTIDITKQKIIERELEQANNLKQQFIENMQHDLRTPVSGISGYLVQLLEDESNLERKEQLTLLSNSANELLSLVNSIVDFENVGYADLPITEQKIDVRMLIARIKQLYLPIINRKNIQIKSSVESNIPEFILGDDFRLHRILLNLVDNAIKYTDDGEINISLELASNDTGTIKLRFTISDTGIGIPEEKQQIVYEKFARLHHSNTERYKGAGLGLSLVKKFIEDLNGFIELSSMEDVGTQFSVVIPFKKLNKGRTESFCHEDLEKSKSKISIENDFYRVLVVEDNPLAQKIAKKILNNDGADAILAKNGQEALDLVKEYTFKFILMDIGLPDGESGISVTKKIIQSLKEQAPPIFAITAHDDTKKTTECLESGMLAVYQKPFNVNVLNAIKATFNQMN